MPHPVDSIPRKLIAYLRATIPADVEAPIFWDAVAQWHKDIGDSPMCVLVAHPSIPELRHGGTVDADTRNVVVGVDLVWDAKEGERDGLNYDRFERAVNAIVDAMASLQGTTTLGTNVLRSELDPSECEIGADVESFKYIARLKIDVQFVR